jgi:hypothetical protein
VSDLPDGPPPALPDARTEPAWMRSRRRVFALCNAFGFSRATRLDYATVFLDRNVESYSDLSPVEIARLRDALEGAALACMFQIEMRRGERR